jgi:hypothetical protein
VREDIAKLQSNRLVGVISADSQKSVLEGLNKEVKRILEFFMVRSRCLFADGG